MPPEDQATRSAPRCVSHPGRASVAVCDVCGRPLCLACAVPVRGQVIGPECLPEVLGTVGRPSLDPVSRPERHPAFIAAGLGLAAAAVGTVLPWTRFGTGSGSFGAWGAAPLRWSSLATVACVGGLTLWAMVAARPNWESPFTHLGIVALAIASGVGALLHMLNPPPFTHPWLGPWVTVTGDAVAGVAGTWLTSRRIGAEEESREPAGSDRLAP